MAEFLSPPELAAWLGIPVPTLYRWRTIGDGPAAYRVGKHLRYRRSDVEAWLAAQRDKAPAA